VTLYALQKLIRDINRNPATRARFMEAPEVLAGEHPLGDEERRALTARDYGALYALGVHGLLLRPFSILHQVPEAAYLAAIRGDRT
jgi:hypothetical protein